MLKRRPLSLPYEDQVPLLASLLREGPGGGAPGERPADSDRFVEAARYHRVAPYVAQAVEAERIQLPARLRDGLSMGGAASIIRSAALRAELARLVPVLEAACGVSPACIKGPAIADRFYPDPRLRPFVDLDLLVPHASLDPAIDALQGRGYEVREEFQAGFGAHHGHEVHLIRRNGHPLNVELHWRVWVDPVAAGLDHAVLSSDRLSVDGVEVAVPDPPAQLVCLAVHLLSDPDKRLIWVQDIVLISADAAEERWQGAFKVADELGLGWVLHRALDYASRHLGFERERPIESGPKPAWGPLRAVEELDLGASVHVGRLALLPWRQRPRYLRDVLFPNKEGLRARVGKDEAPTWRLVGRNLRTAVLGLGRRRH